MLKDERIHQFQPRDADPERCGYMYDRHAPGVDEGIICDGLADTALHQTPADRYRVGNKQPRNIYDDRDYDEPNGMYGRWLATAGDPADAKLIITALNFLHRNTHTGETPK